MTESLSLEHKNIAGQEKKEEISFPLVSASTMTDKPVQIEWLVENIIEQSSLNLLFGEPASGKSLFTLDWAFCMTAGIDWHGYRTKQTDVVIIAGEGFAGMQRRLRALEIKYQMKAPASLFISKQPAQLMNKNNAQLVANSIKAICANPGLVIIDTLHRNMEGDENSSKEIGMFINNIDTYMKPLNAAILIVHHSGHGNKERSRGSSAIRAAMDGEFSVQKSNDNIITLTCHKAKDFEPLAPLYFALKLTELEWLNSDGEPITSVYLEKGEASIKTKKSKLSARDEEIFASLATAIAEHGVEPEVRIKAEYEYFNSPTGEMQKVVNMEHWKKNAYQALEPKTDSESARRMAFKRCRDKLLSQSLIVEYDNYVWEAFESK